MTEQRQFTKSELEAAKAQIRHQARVREQQRHQDAVALHLRTSREIDEKYIALLGVSPEEFERLSGIFCDYHEEREQRL